MVMPEKRRTLMAVFVLSLQVDVYLRFYLGKGMDQEGLSFPLVVMTGSVLFLWCAWTARLKDFHWAGSMGAPILALLVTSLLSLSTTSERFVTATQIWYRVELYFVYFLAFNLVRSTEDFRRVVNLLFITLAAQSIIYFVQSSLGVTFDFAGKTFEEGDIPRPGGTVSTNPAGFASFIMPALMIASAMVMVKYKAISRPYVLVLMMLGSAAIALTFTRAAWIGFAAGIVAIFVLGYRSRLIKAGMFLWILAFAGIAFGILFPTMMARLSEDYTGGGGDLTQGGLEERVGLMRIALNVILHHPLTGVGAGAYGSVFKSYIPDGLNQWLFVVHNEFLLRAAETGIPGMIAFVALLVVAFRIALRLARTTLSLISVTSMGWFGALIALVWQMNWVPWTGWSYNAMFWFMLGLIDAARRLVQQDGHLLRTARSHSNPKQRSQVPISGRHAVDSWTRAP
jgi:hypothetical protein